MADVTTVDITGIQGSDKFPLNENDVLNLVETIASQRITGLKSANKLEDAFFEYDIENGKVVEEAVIEMAKEQAYDKDAYDRAPKDPTLYAKYFNNYDSKQFQTTVRRDDIRAIIANKGAGVEEVVGDIIDSLTQGESAYDFKQKRNVFFNGTFYDYKNHLNGTPSNMDGVLYAIRDMYNALRSNNAKFTSYNADSSTPEADIRIAVTPKLLNLLDVTKLANIFNLSKVEMFGKFVVIDVDDLSEATNYYKVWAYDRKALGRATRIYDFTDEKVAKGRFYNYYLTTERAYFHNTLFKSCVLDCTTACNTALATIVTPLNA